MSESAAHAHEVAHHFDSIEQQRDALTLGMWIFLVTEVMFFGGLFAVYTIYRSRFPAAFAEGSRHLDIVLGTINTALLLISSYTVVLAVHAAQTDRREAIVLFLGLTLLFGMGFLGIKGFEYYHKFHDHHVPGPHFRLSSPEHDNVEERHVEIFFGLYFAMTGLHALHMVIGVGIFVVIVVLVIQGRFSSAYYAPVEVAGLYWHFVDIVWVFLFPLLYLVS